VKSPIQRRVTIAALLLAPALTACGFNVQTDQVYQPAVGPNDRSGDVNILNAVVVSDTDGSGTFAGTLVNTADEDTRLDGVSGPGVTASRSTVEIDPVSAVNLAESGVIRLEGEEIEPGRFVELTFTFSNGQSTTIDAVVVSATGPYAEVPVGETSSESDDSESE
jgi:hypothetical protein